MKMRYEHFTDELNRLGEVGCFDNGLTLNIEHRQMHPIPISSNVCMSIQASFGHYCTPKSYKLLPLKTYKTMEIAFIASSGQFVDFSVIYPTYPRLSELQLHYGDGIYSYVPVDLIQDVYVFIKKHYKSD